MEAEEAQDYARLKEELLRRFKLTEGGYRKKFKKSSRDEDETVSQYVERLRRYLRQWLQMAEIGEGYEGLETLILRDQFFINCDNEMRKFLKEKWKLELSEMLKQAQNFLDARESDERKWDNGYLVARTRRKTISIMAENLRIQTGVARL